MLYDSCSHQSSAPCFHFLNTLKVITTVMTCVCPENEVKSSHSHAVCITSEVRSVTKLADFYAMLSLEASAAGNKV